MSEVRPRSRKLRALQQAAGSTLEAVVAEYAPKPLSYEEIAEQWTASVERAFPELGLQFTKTDVYRLFRRFHVHGREVVP